MKKNLNYIDKLITLRGYTGVKFKKSKKFVLL